MKLSGANPVHALFAILRERMQDRQNLPAALRPEALQQVRDTVRSARSPDPVEEAAKIDSFVATPNDDAMAVAMARLRSNISFVAADGVNKLSQFESGRSWELASLDPSTSQAPPGPNPRAVHAESATRFTPSSADISEAMEVLAALSSRPQLYGGQLRHEAKTEIRWKHLLGRTATILLGVSILFVVLSSL